MLLASLTTSDIDTAGSVATLEAFSSSGAFQHVLPHLFSANALTIALACAVCQNACTHLELVHAMESNGSALDRLIMLAQCEVPADSHPARASLHNIEATKALATIALDAIVRVQRGVRRRQQHAHRRGLTVRRIDIARAARCLSQSPPPLDSPPTSPPSPPPSPPMAPFGMAPTDPLELEAECGRAVTSPRAPPTLAWPS